VCPILLEVNSFASTIFPFSANALMEPFRNMEKWRPPFARFYKVLNVCLVCLAKISLASPAELDLALVGEGLPDAVRVNAF